MKGNEPADRLADLTISGDNIDIDIGLELSEAYDLVDRYIIIGKWQHNWENEATASHYRTIQRKVSTKIKFLHPSRHPNVVKCINKWIMGSIWLLR